MGRSDKTGKVLAEVLLHSLQGNRTIGDFEIQIWYGRLFCVKQAVYIRIGAPGFMVRYASADMENHSQSKRLPDGSKRIRFPEPEKKRRRIERQLCNSHHYSTYGFDSRSSNWVKGMVVRFSTVIVDIP
ncbi:hypothetical protein HKD37_14G040452 [Glycine soja]